MSCKKEVNARLTATDGLKQLGKILFHTYDGNVNGIWLMNYDGTGKQKLNITLPSGNDSFDNVAKLSPDGKRVFYTAFKNVNGATKYPYEILSLYSCELDGTGLKMILDGNSQGSDELLDFDVY